jgi:ribose transport system substrate-binding protein
MRRFIRPLLPALISAVALAGSAVTALAAEKLQIAVVPKGSTHAFWKSVEAGARKAGVEEDVTIIWKGPMKEDDRAQQMAMVDTLILRKVDAIGLAPLDAVALRDKAARATEAGIPVAIFDSPLAKPEGASFAYVGTDNFEAGKLGA